MAVSTSRRPYKGAWSPLLYLISCKSSLSINLIDINMTVQAILGLTPRVSRSQSQVNKLYPNQLYRSAI